MALVSKSSGSRQRIASFRDLGIDFPLIADAYELESKIGTGGSATVWRARCKPLQAVVAVKLVELEELQTALDLLIKEAHTMMSLRHPNVLHLHGSFISGETLWLVMPYISGGSLSEVLHSQFPAGMEEALIVTIARDILRGLEYLHRHAMAHRDLKADNLLIHEEGRVLLADFGATAKLERIEFSGPVGGSARSTASLASIAESPDTSIHSSSTAPGSETSTPMRSASSASSWSRYLSRQTFVGTPNYMAPEVMLQTDEGYNQSADIWSFGIVLLELARGKVPLQNCSFTKIIVDTVHGPAPCLDSDGKQKFSKALCSLVARCLNKEPDLRPSAAELLKDPLFRQAHDGRWLAKRLLGTSDKSSGGSGRRVTFKDGREGSPSGSVSPRQTTAAPQTYRTMPSKSLFSRAGSRTLNDVADADPHRQRLVHHLAWAFHHGGRPYIMVYELSQWFGKARLFIEGVEVMVKRYSFLQQLTFSQDHYQIKIDNAALGPIHGCHLAIRVAAQMGVSLMGVAKLEGQDLPLPVYCERESLKSAPSGITARSDDSSSSASHSPLSILDVRQSSSSESIASLPAAAGLSATAADGAAEAPADSEPAVTESLQKVSLSSIPETEVAEPPLPERAGIIASPFEAFAAQQPGEPWPVPGSPGASSADVSSAAASCAHDSAVALGAAFRAAELTEASLYGPPAAAPHLAPAAAAPNQAASPNQAGSSDHNAQAGGSRADVPAQSLGRGQLPSRKPDLGDIAGAAVQQQADKDESDLDVRMRLAVERSVSAEVARLRLEFTNREQMLMAAVMGHSERERELHERLRALEKLVAAHVKPGLAHEA